MTGLVFIVLMLGGATALVDLSCSDNATCIEGMGRDLVQSLREQKAVRLFELVTIEPLSRREGRSSKGLWGLVQNHALSFDWNDFTFRFTLPEDGRDDALDMEMFEYRSVKDEADTSAKKSSSKVEEDREEDKTPKMGLNNRIKRRKRRQKKKVMQALIPLLFGMKSAGAVIFAFALVSALTMKAFVASKMALVVTIGMALKRLYETYSTGVGFQNHPYLYSQYPIDFPSASSHAYSVSGVSPQFASNEMYNSNIMPQELLQQQDASAQQSQQAPLLLNNTAAERWDGKSKLQKLLEPLIDGFKNVINPIANIFYGAMPTFRGLNTEVSTDKTVEADSEETKKPREFLVPQPRFIAQRKNFVKLRTRPKKFTELKLDLDRLKRNKDFQDYIKTKKYKHNYPNTHYYPRVKYVLYNPNNFLSKPNNSRLLPYRIPPVPTTTPADITPETTESSDWKPIAVFNETTTQSTTTNFPIKNYPNFSLKKYNRFFRKRQNLKRRKRIKRDVSINASKSELRSIKSRGFSSMFDFITDFFEYEPVYEMLYKADHATKTTIVENVVPVRKPPLYYSAMYNLLVMTVDVMDGLFGVQKDLDKYYFSDKDKPIKRQKIRRRTKLKNSMHKTDIHKSDKDEEQTDENSNGSVIKYKIIKKKKLKIKKKKIPPKETIQEEKLSVETTTAKYIKNVESTTLPEIEQSNRDTALDESTL